MEKSVSSTLHHIARQEGGKSVVCGKTLVSPCSLVEGREREKDRESVERPICTTLVNPNPPIRTGGKTKIYVEPMRSPLSYGRRTSIQYIEARSAEYGR